MSALVAAGCTLAPEVVPGGGLVAAQRSEPVGEAQEYEAAGAGHAEHLREHALRVGYVLEDVG